MASDLKADYDAALAEVEHLWRLRAACQRATGSMYWLC
jgi:hypothetical protein